MDSSVAKMLLNSLSRSSRTQLRVPWSLKSLKCQQRAPWRGIAAVAAAPDTSALPLAGIKVLDMTRVLAGVSIIPLIYAAELKLTLKHSHTVRRS
jgi:hypothetical protein